MRILKFLLSTLLVLFGIYLLGGSMLPDEWAVSRSTMINANVDQIYPYVSNFKEWPKWSPWNTSNDTSLKYTYEGSESGVGAKQSWISEKMGTGWMKITSADRQKGIDYHLFIDMGGTPTTLNGNIAFSPDGQQTKVTWTDHGNADKSYINRWISFLLKPMLSKDIDRGLAGLKEVVEKK